VPPKMVSTSCPLRRIFSFPFAVRILSRKASLYFSGFLFIRMLRLLPSSLLYSQGKGLRITQSKIQSHQSL
jgi:hypothetical protein